MASLEKEIEVLNQLRRLIASEHMGGIRRLLSDTTNNMVSDEFLLTPKTILASISLKLDLLASVGLDVKSLSDRHSELVNEIDAIVKELKKIPEHESLSDPYNFADSVLDTFKVLIYSFIDVAYLREEVDNLCNNYIMIIEKIAM
jgi:flagellar biosynthesis/type III secretory pathway chaperone